MLLSIDQVCISLGLNILSILICVLDLTKHVVKDYEGIENLMDEGNTNR